MGSISFTYTYTYVFKCSESCVPMTILRDGKVLDICVPVDILRGDGDVTKVHYLCMYVHAHSMLISHIGA